MYKNVFCAIMKQSQNLWTCRTTIPCVQRAWPEKMAAAGTGGGGEVQGTMKQVFRSGDWASGGIRPKCGGNGCLSSESGASPAGDILSAGGSSC
ncbi:hypothetical protein FKM82_008295 [Ascaphus truei]